MNPAKRKLPHLLPVVSTVRDDKGVELREISLGTSGLSRKRRNVAVACQRCRERKIRCDGVRPQCVTCRNKSLDCVFETFSAAQDREMKRVQMVKYHAVLKLLQEGTLAEAIQVLQTVRGSANVEHGVDKALASQSEPSSDTMTELFRLLQDESEDAALDAFRSLRRGHSPETILRSIGGDMSGRVTPSLHTTNRSLLPPTQTPVEFQLVVEHTNVYPPLVPLDVASLDLQLLGIKPLSVIESRKESPSSWSHVHELTTNLSSTVDPQSILVKDIESRPRDLLDPRLNRLTIRRWTNINISDQLAAEAISLYLRMNQPWWSFFDQDLFLDDLISGHTKFCSRLLVNAVLAWSAQSYAHYEPLFATLSRKFLDEATKMYDVECNVDSLTTVAATSLMSLTWKTLGRDKAGYNLQYESACMATRLGLYAGPGEPPYSPLNLQDKSVKTAACVAAWGSFNFQMVMSMSYHQDPLPRGLPSLPIPGELHDPVYADGVSTSQITYVFVCRFWLVVFEMNLTYYSQNAASLSAAVAIFQKFLAWASTLNAGVERNESNPDHVLNLHIWFHTAVIDLFRPFANEQPQPNLSIFGAVRATPVSMIAASIQQLKRLIYQYRSNFESSKYSIRDCLYDNPLSLDNNPFCGSGGSDTRC